MLDKIHNAIDLSYAVLNHQDDLTEEEFNQLEEDLILGTNYGFNVAALNLGALYYQGRFVQQDYQKALEYYHLAANTGNIVAMNNLGYIYYYGRDVEVDYEQAYLWFSKAAMLGDMVSLYKVGDMFKSGKYVKQDTKTAADLYIKAFAIMYEQSKETGETPPFFEDAQIRAANAIFDYYDTQEDLESCLYLATDACQAFEQRVNNGDHTAKSGLRWSTELIEDIQKKLNSVEHS